MREPAYVSVQYPGQHIAMSKASRCILEAAADGWVPTLDLCAREEWQDDDFRKRYAALLLTTP